jgi:hypothetical protein
MQESEHEDPAVTERRLLEREVAGQWVGGGTLPDSDEVWSVPGNKTAVP